MTDIVERLRDADNSRRIGESYADTHERRQRDRNEAAAEIERLKAEVSALNHAEVKLLVQVDEQYAKIERLRAALRWIAKHPRGGVIDTPEKMDRDEFIGIARAALKEDGDD